MATDSRENPFRIVFFLAAREIRDTLRDWRIVMPIVVLTLFFPLLMNFVADLALSWVARYGDPIIGERLIPFLLMIVGFFPISFSLVIALETFVGEKERSSLEPLLATPLTDTQLYFGKMIAAVVPPLLAAYLGIGVYMAGLYFTTGWTPSPELFALVVALTTAEGLVMVSAAVVLSSQATSVRAANLLASFVIIPMALLIQGEAMIMFYANYGVLWWVMLFLILVNVMLVRMGLHLFNREELLGREIDELNLGSLWRTFYKYFAWERWCFGKDTARWPAGLRWMGTLCGLYFRDIPAILRRSRPALALVGIALLGALYIGASFAARYPMPRDVFQLDKITLASFQNEAALAWLPSISFRGILLNNVRSLVLATLLAVFSFGTLAVALLMAPFTIGAFFIYLIGGVGYNPLIFTAVFFLPHGVLEIPAAVIATALAARLGATFMSPPRGMTVGEGWLWALADTVKAFFALTLPLLALAAAVEAYVTPALVVWVY